MINIDLFLKTIGIANVEACSQASSSISFFRNIFNSDLLLAHHKTHSTHIIFNDNSPTALSFTLNWMYVLCVRGYECVFVQFTLCASSNVPTELHLKTIFSFNSIYCEMRRLASQLFKTYKIDGTFQRSSFLSIFHMQNMQTLIFSILYYL